jgi:hypothetical protein
MSVILAIGAHFDDIEIGCAGTLFQHVSNGDVVLLSILNADENKTGLSQDRFKEQIESLKLLNIPYDNLILFNGDRVYRNSRIIGELDKIKPDIIYVPSEKDTHQDHRRCFEIGQSIGRKRSMTTLMYHCGSSIDFNPNLFNIINWDEKFKILKCFSSQIICRSINIDIIKAKERYFATLISEKENDHAEGFVSRKMRYFI